MKTTPAPSIRTILILPLTKRLAVALSVVECNQSRGTVDGGPPVLDSFANEVVSTAVLDFHDTCTVLIDVKSAFVAAYISERC